MKKMILLLSVAAGFMVCSGVNAAPYTLNVNSALTAEDPLFKGLNQFKAEVEKTLGRAESKSNCSPVRNSARMRTFLNRRAPVLGSPWWSMAVGWGPFVKEFGILGAPVSWPTIIDEMRKIVTSPLLETWVQKLAHDLRPSGLFIQLVSR